jgi:hypothetical protein
MKELHNLIETMKKWFKIGECRKSRGDNFIEILAEFYPDHIRQGYSAKNNPSKYPIF